MLCEISAEGKLYGRDMVNYKYEFQRYSPDWFIEMFNMKNNNKVGPVWRNVSGHTQLDVLHSPYSFKHQVYKEESSYFIDHECEFYYNYQFLSDGNHALIIIYLL